MNKIVLYCVMLIAGTQIMRTQNTHAVSLQFSPLFENQRLELGKKYDYGNPKSTISITEFKCYVSHFEFYKEGHLSYTAENSYFLLDASAPTSLTRTLNIPNTVAYDEVRFYMGVDDKTNENGIGEGDLDPSLGMYWTWQTGYINLKIEGTSSESSRADKAFQFHLGGFIAPYASFQLITLKPVSSDTIVVALAIDRFLQAVSLKETNTVMSPGEKSVSLSKTAAQLFRL
ncbi:MbnP family protein [Flavobacterium sp. XGLA_31]|uniref:MbnP family protein n=1 Tax=Flavobacterium sp. XGLA_31 TaxID=3447666 RepID=UPI003F3847EB